MQIRHILGFTAVLAMLVFPTSVAAQPAGFCAARQTPTFRFGFAGLKDQLGDAMGIAVECEHANAVNGDSLQRTTTGLAFYRKSTNIPTFTNGYEHWALTLSGLTYWTGVAIDPPTETPANLTASQTLYRGTAADLLLRELIAGQFGSLAYTKVGINFATQTWDLDDPTQPKAELLISVWTYSSISEATTIWRNKWSLPLIDEQWVTPGDDLHGIGDEIVRHGGAVGGVANFGLRARTKNVVVEVTSSFTNQSLSEPSLADYLRDIVSHADQFSW